MNMLTVCALVCTIMALVGSAETQEENNETAKTHLVKRALSCARGWSEINRRCFFYIAKPMSWAKAEKNCITLGGHLASVHNFWEYHYLQRLILSGSNDFKETWIGGSDAQEESHWFWSDGTTFQYTNWCRREPNNYGGHQHCLMMNHGGGKCWDDLACNSQRPSVCVKNK